MQQEKDLIIATTPFAKEDRAKSWRLLFTALLLLLGGFALALADIHLIPRIIASIVTGLLLVRFFIMYHDYLHKSILQRSTLAEAIFTVFGWYILAPVSIWRRSHDYHHAHNAKLYTTSIGSYPLVTKKDFLAASNLDRRLYLFARHPFTIGFGYLFVFIFGMCLRSLINNPKKHADSLVSLIFHIGLGVLIGMTLGWQALLFGFLIPNLISFAMGAYLFYAQHNFPDAKYRRKEEWSYVYAALHSSSYMKMSKLMHWFTGNIGYHHIHHMNSKIPFYRLPEVHAAIQAFQQPGVTSLSPKDIYACFKIKVWDPEQSRMIGLREIYS